MDSSSNSGVIDQNYSVPVNTEEQVLDFETSSSISLNSSASDEDNFNDTSSSLDYRSPDCSSDSESNSSLDSSNNVEFPQNEENVVDQDSTLRQKLHLWAVTYRNNLSVQSIEDLLQKLRDYHSELPKSSATLLQTKSNKIIKEMKILKNTNGQFVYFGIEEGLKGVITGKYVEEEIHLLFNVDGLPLYSQSFQQFWTILGHVLHKKYTSEPFVIAVFSGDSKPKCVDDFMRDFILELNNLILNGIVLGQLQYCVHIAGFVCDTPARAFLKKCKGHGGFFWLRTLTNKRKNKE